VCQLRVCLEQVHHGMRELPHLLQRAADDLVPRRRGQRELLRVRVPDRLPLPVLDLEDQQPSAGVKDHEVRVPVLRADRDVVPAEVVVFEVTAQAGSKSAARRRPPVRIRAKMPKREKDSPMSPSTRIVAPPLASHATAGVPDIHVMVEEGCAPVTLVVRVRLVADKLTEIKFVATHDAKEGLIFNLNGLQATTAATNIVPRPDQLATRDDAIRIAMKYAEGLASAKSFAAVNAPFAADAFRLENGQLMAASGEEEWGVGVGRSSSSTFMTLPISMTNLSNAPRQRTKGSLKDDWMLRMLSQENMLCMVA
jgi:hypothetical protein